MGCAGLDFRGDWAPSASWGAENAPGGRNGRNSCAGGGSVAPGPFDGSMTGPARDQELGVEGSARLAVG